MALTLTVDPVVCGTNGGTISGSFSGAPSGSEVIIGIQSSIYGVQSLAFPATTGSDTFLFPSVLNDNWLVSAGYNMSGLHEFVSEFVTVACAPPVPVETTLTHTPLRDWLPVYAPVTFKFQSPDAQPEILAVRIEVSDNGTDFAAWTSAGVLLVSPTGAGVYTVNAGPMLEAMFDYAPPVLPGTDTNLWKYFRLSAGKLSLFDGVTGTPELTTGGYHVLNGFEARAVSNVGFITLTDAPYGIRSVDYHGIETAVNTLTGYVQNNVYEHDPEDPTPQVCPKNPVHLFWLNRAGGWQNYVFDGNHEYTQEIGEAQTWTDSNFVVHKAVLPPVEEGVTVYSGFVQLAWFDVITGIRQAIRVYELKDSQWKEVNIEPGTFRLHKEGQLRRSVDFSFTYGQTIPMQHS